MQQVVVAKPYKFVPPHQGTLWPWLLQKLLPYHVRSKWGVEKTEFHGLGHLQASLAAGHGILLAPNHCRPVDPFVLGLLGARLGRPMYAMASSHLFMQGGLQRWLLRRAGVFSVFREGMDKEALKTATQLLAQARRPLVIFPEGIISRGNDRLGYLQEGVAFIARAAAKARAKAETAGLTPGEIVIHPVCLRYTFHGDLRQTIGPVLDMIERRIAWLPYTHLPLMKRISRLGEAVLSVKEVEYFGTAQPGARSERILKLIERVLEPLEALYAPGKKEATVVGRIKKIRAAIVPALTQGELPAEEQERRWRHLDDCSFAQALDLYPRGYLEGTPTAERLLETVERLEEDSHDDARIHRPIHCRLEVGAAIPVTTERPRGEADPLIAQLDESLKKMLADSAHLCHPWKE
ncbi:MAG TPA: 1-acyl-sn-glycerol-3-phosphate acyltransferase [Gemmatales bacterium]|nr:1-acyl-sn-glycerol-3-phosphate acyltransferase [Gemmatales bacterium]